MSYTENDGLFLLRALALAERGIALASPNPCVGAVVVREGAVVGEGFHTYDGIQHAEILALDQAGSQARGATLYINLEPCSHQGRTGPCVDALIAAGISRVVACMNDPNPQVSGNGFERLRRAGITVDIGSFEREARKLNENFAKYIRHGTPLVTLKSAMTLDGKIAASSSKKSSEPEWITGAAARSHVQQLRHQNDAILVGVGTVLADDPLLTDRSGEPRRRRLLRVVLDSRLRLPLDSRLVQTAEDDVMILCSQPNDNKKKRLEERGVRVEQILTSSANALPDIPSAVGILGKMQMMGLLIEGGSRVNWVALDSGVVDKVFLYYAPTILADAEAVPFAASGVFRQAPRVKAMTVHRFGEDFAVEGYLQDPYGD
jgi:diaminohydroxyphosphoribosylaminopyrimidine deaminase/5-amino-6-(5-phosphoribosylamino)uracil reductase